MENFVVGQSFEGLYPPEAAVWCNKNGAYIEECGGSYIIRAVPKPSPEEVQAEALNEKMAEFDKKLADLKDRTMLALLDNDDAALEEARKEYNALMEA